MRMGYHQSDFRKRLLDGERIAGTFIKTPTPHATEILAGLGFDFVVVDQEHAPFDRGDIDGLMSVTSAIGIGGIVRVADPSWILPALDMGADGVLVPHVNSREAAEQVVAAARHGGGSRGYSPSTRAGRYGGLTLEEHVARADESVSVWAMIEHPDAIADAAAIAAVDGVDALFLGLGDRSAWRPDREIVCSGLTLLVIPPRMIHTTSWSTAGARLVDIFAPPRDDFSMRRGLVRNADDYPLPERLRDEVER